MPVANLMALHQMILHLTPIHLYTTGHTLVQVLHGTAANPVGWNLRAGTAGTLANSILVSTKSKGLEVQDKAAGVNDAYSKLVAGEIKLMSNLFYEIGAFTTMDAAGIIRVGSAAEDKEATASDQSSYYQQEQNWQSWYQIHFKNSRWRIGSQAYFK
jgi:hypothetical protein